MIQTNTPQKHIPQLRFKEFDGEWEKKKLGECCSVIMGQSPDSKSYNDKGEGYYLIQGNADIKNRLSNPRQWTSEPTKKCEIGDVILTVRAPVGAVAKSVHEACIGRGVSVIRKIDEYEINFVYQFLLDFENKWGRLEQGSTFTAVSGSDIKGLKLNLPTLPEQQKIASFLSGVDDKIQQLSRKKELLEQYKKGVMQQLFSGKLRFKPDPSEVEGQEDGTNYPDWEEKYFKDIVLEYRLGGNYTNTEEETIYPLIKMGNLGRGKINTKKIEYIPIGEEIDEKDKIEYGDLFFNTRNTLDLVGKVSIWRNELPVAYYNSNLMYMKFENNFFMNYRLNSYEGVKGLKRFATGTTSVAAIYTKDLLKLVLKMPCLEEQQKIASYLTGLDAKIASVGAQITQSQTFKKGLLQQMFV